MLMQDVDMMVLFPFFILVLSWGCSKENTMIHAPSVSFSCTNLQWSKKDGWMWRKKVPVSTYKSVCV